LAYALEGAAGIPVELAAPVGSLGATFPLKATHEQSWPNLLRASLEAQKIKTDILYIAESAALKAALWSGSWLKRQRLRLLLHGSEILELRHSSAFRRALAQAERIYTLSQAVADLVCGLDKNLSAKITLIGAAPAPELLRHTLPEAHDLHHLITVGRLHPRKGQLELLRLLEQTPALNNFRYSIVGPARRGSYAKKLESMAAQLSPRASIYGEVSWENLASLYSNAGIFVLCARTLRHRIEGFGLALLDAMACGVLPIAYASGGTPEALGGGEYGILIKEGDTLALEKTLIRLSQKPDEWHERSQKAKAYARNLSWKTVAQRLFAD